MDKKIDLRFSVVRIECDSQRGTGFLVSQEGYILTSAHLISNPRKVRLFFYDENSSFSYECKATEIYCCEEKQGDFCLLKVKGKFPSHSIALHLFSSSQSEGNHFLTYGFPDSNPLEGLEGKGLLQNCNLRSETNFPIIQLEESNSINEGFSGSLIFDTQIGGIVGLVGGGVVDKKNQRQLNTSFGIPIQFIAEKCSEDYFLDVKEPNQVIELPKGFSYLKPPKIEKVSSTKIKYQDFLQSNNLPYFSRDDFQSKNTISGNFITETSIINNLLNSESSEGGIVFGEGGIGKTRLVFEIGQIALNLGWVVIHVKPEVKDIEDLLPVLSPQYKYLLLFDYIEDSQCFNGDIVSTLYQKNENLNLRVLANCRYTFRSSSNFPDTFLQYELLENDNEQLYRRGVTNFITQDLVKLFPVKNITFFDLKPSFAVFLKFLLQKERLETDDIREVGDFKSWIKKRFRLTFKKTDFSDLDKKIIYLLSSLPLKGEFIDAAYKMGFGDICQKLKNDGWIEEVEPSGKPILKVIHDTIVDELLIIHLENARKDIKREVSQILEFSSQFNCQNNWLRSMERIIELPVLSDNNHFFDIFNRCLNKSDNNEIVTPLKYFLATSPVLNETNRIELFYNHIEFFREVIENLFFAKPLSFALNKEKYNKSIEEKFKAVFLVWYNQNKRFNFNFNIAFRIISTYTKYFGLDEFSKKSIKKYLRFHNSKTQTSFVFQAWFENGGELEPIRQFVLNYLKIYCEDANASFVFKAWFENGGELEPIRQFVLNYLKIYCEDANAQFVFGAWLNNGGEIEPVRQFVLNYLKIYCEDANASFVFKAWFENGGELEPIRQFVLNYLKINCEDANASFVFQAWFENGGELEPIRQFVLNYLKIYCEDANAQFVFGAWLNNGGEIEPVRQFVLNYLKINCEDANASFVFKAWFENGGEIEPIRQFVLNYLKIYCEDANARFVFGAWLNNGGEIELVRQFVLNYLKIYCEDANAQFVFGAWLNNGGEIEPVRQFVLNYLKINCEDANASFVFKAWFENGGEIEPVRQFVLNYLKINCEDANASFVFKAWFENGGEIEPVRQFVLNYLKINCEEPNASFVFKAWLENGGEIEPVREHVLSYLNINCEEPNAQFVFAAWLNHGGEIEPIKQFVLNYLKINCEDANARFVFGAWLNNGGEIEPVREHVLSYLNINCEEPNAQFVFGAWLNNGGEIEPVRQFVLNYLKINCEDANASFVFQAWFENGGEIEPVRQFVLNYLKINCEDANARFVLEPWLNNRGEIHLISEYVLKYLKINCEDANASFVFQAWFEAKGDLKLIKAYLLRYFGKNAKLKNTGFHFGFWIRSGGKVNEIEIFIIQYLEVNSFFNESSYIIRPIINDNSILIEKFESYIVTFLFSDTNFLQKTLILSSWIKRKEKLNDIKPLIMNFLTQNIKLELSQMVIATWLNKSGELKETEIFVKKYLTLHATKIKAQHVINAWLRIGGNITVLEPFIYTYLKKHAIHENTGYIYIKWLNAGGSFEKIKEYLRVWFNIKQPSLVAGRVCGCLFQENIIKESYREIYD